MLQKTMELRKILSAQQSKEEDYEVDTHKTKQPLLVYKDA